MLTPAYLRNAAEPVVDLFSQVESDITADIARRIVKAGFVTETAQYQLEKAQEIGLLQGNIEKILSEASGKSDKEVSKLMKEAGVESLKFDDSIYRKAGLKPTAIENSPIVRAVLLQGVDKTNALVSNFTKTAATTSTRAFTSALDRCYLQILSGAFDRNSAIKLAVRDLAKQGIEKVAYPSGATSSMEAAARRAVTTGLNQSVSKLQLARADDMGCDLVEVTSHAGARPSHAEWQGKIYCIRGKHKGYGDFYRETGYGEGDGLCGWNCYHSFFPYFEGLSVKSFSLDPAKEFLGKENDEMYEQQQKQRYYERRIRAAKKECAVYSAAMDSAIDPELKESLEHQLLISSDKLRSREASLNSFLAQTGRTKDPSRVVVGGWNRNEMTTSKTKIAREAKEAAESSVGAAAGKTAQEQFNEIRNRYKEEAREKKLELVLQEGKAYAERFEKEIKAINEDYSKRIAAIDNKIDSIRVYSPDIRKLYQEKFKLQDEIAGKRAEAAQKFVSSLRQTGADQKIIAEKIIALKGKTKEETERNERACSFVRSAIQAYPTDWANSVLNAGIKVTMANRGSCSGIKIEVDRKGLPTAFHELAHMFEDRNPVIADLEAKFYEKRTEGEPLVKLRDVMKGGGYAPNEVTKVDSWFNPYVGRWYGDRSYEIMSMGLERIMTGDLEIMADPEHARFIFGILALV